MDLLTNHARMGSGPGSEKRSVTTISDLTPNFLEFGRIRPAGNGCEIVFFDNKARRRLGSGPGSEKRSVATIGGPDPEFPDFYAIVGSDGKVITVGHRTRRIPRDR